MYLDYLTKSYICKSWSDLNKLESTCTYVRKHFCDYLPFEEELVLYLYNFEILLPKDDLYHVWLKLA